ncbi:MAG TPA: cupin domain-containing protein [Hyphomicrobiaceae bacterium]|nr:cupin domain-containing protein [Hyphomicrobiaceae bacterium]
MISKRTAEHYTWGGDCDGWHLVKRDELSVIHERMPAGRAEVRHHHRMARQLFFVLSGTLTMVLSDRHELIGPGEAVEIPPGEVHRAENRGDGPVEFLVISHPSTRGDRIETAS